MAHINKYLLPKTVQDTARLPNVTVRELAMAQGPPMMFEVYKCMDYQGANFLTAGRDLGKVTAQNLIHTWFTEAHHMRHPYIGRAQQFFRIMPRWATGPLQQQQEERLHTVDAKWFQIVTQYEYLYNVQ